MGYTFKEMMKRPLESRCDELTRYLYESVKEETKNETIPYDISIIGFYIDEDIIDVVSEDTLAKNINLKNKVKSVAVEIRTNEGWEKPHLHVLNEHFNCAIRLDKPEYFIHPGAPDTFHNNKQKKIFDDFMGSLIYDKSMTYWEYARFIFNNIFGPKGHPLNCSKKPDYTKL